MASLNGGGKRKREGKDQRPRKFKQTPQAPDMKSFVEYYQRLPRIPKFPWSECYQPASALVNFKPESVLLRIFTRYLTLKEAFRLGKTCRRMYHLYRLSCTQTRKSLILVVDKNSGLTFPQTLASYALLFEGIFTTNSAHISALKPLPNSQLDYRTPFGDLPLFSLHQLLASTLTSLTYLEISASMRLPNLPELCKILKNSCFVHLETLKLYLHCADILSANIDLADVDRSVLPRNGAYCQLDLPHLKHLTLALLNGHLIYYDSEAEVVDVLGPNAIRAKSYSPLTIRSRRLCSLHLSTADALPRLCSLIHQYVLLSREQNGMGEGDGSNHSNSENDIQIAYHLRRSHTSELRAMLSEHPNLLQGYAQAMAFISYLQVQPRYVPPAGFCLFLPLMSRLRVINFWAGGTADEAAFYYPAVLHGLSYLPVLTQIVVDFTGFGEDAHHCIGYLTLPVLPTVRKLEMRYPIRSVHRHPPLQQVDIVEQLHLARCFPGLTSFRVHFEQLPFSRFIVQTSTTGGQKELVASQELVRGLTQLPVQAAKREVIFTFRDPQFSLLYRSVDNSVQLIRSKQWFSFEI